MTQRIYAHEQVAWQRDKAIRRAKDLLVKTVSYFLLISTSALFLFPLFWVVSTSLKTMEEANAPRVVWLPSNPQFDAYAQVLADEDWLLFFSNSVFVTVLAVGGTLISVAFVAYAFSRIEWPGRDIVFFLMLSTMMLPPQITLVPQYVLFHLVGWLRTFNPIIIPGFFAGGAMLVFLLRQFMLTLPKELDEAAIIDGASHLQIWWYIILPHCKAALATVGVLLFVGNWNSLQVPLIYLQKANLQTLPIAIAALYNPQQSTQPWPRIMAVSLLTILPLLIVFLFLQRYFVEGIATTGRKG